MNPILYVVIAAVAGVGLAVLILGITFFARRGKRPRSSAAVEVGRVPADPLDPRFASDWEISLVREALVQKRRDEAIRRLLGEVQTLGTGSPQPAAPIVRPAPAPAPATDPPANDPPATGGSVV